MQIKKIVKLVVFFKLHVGYSLKTRRLRQKHRLTYKGLFTIIQV